MIIKLNYKLKTTSERVGFIKELLLRDFDDLAIPARQCEIMANYILSPLTKKDKKARFILYPNRELTINKRETSLESIFSKFSGEGNEDAAYAIFNQDKNQYLCQKNTITAQNIAEVPGLIELRKSIEDFKTLMPTLTGKNRQICQKLLIQMQKDQYFLKDTFYQPPARARSRTASSVWSVDLTEHITFNEDNEPVSDGKLTLFNPKHVAAVLNCYSSLKEECEDHFNSDMYYFLLDFDKIADAALQNFPVLEEIVTLKVDGLSASQIQMALIEKFEVNITAHRLSYLWRRRIPKLISEKAKENYLLWYYTYEEQGKWKKCSRCGQIKLMHNRFFSKNNTSKDGYYSICKCCRNKKDKKGW